MKAPLAAIILFVSIMQQLAWAKSPHYTFILPDRYVGWVQIIFNDPQAFPFPLRKDRGYEIAVPESGITRTSHIRVHDARSKDEFYYRSFPSNGKSELFPVPSGYVMPGESHGGFGVMDTGGKGTGYSWFIFIGPPELRAKVPLADWDRVVEEYSKTHGGSKRVESSDPYPTPGRMPSVKP
jgi:uncharacterized protein DUF6843